MAVKSCYFWRCEAAVCTEISYKKAIFSQTGSFSSTCQTAWPVGVHQERCRCCPFMHRVLSRVETSGQVSRGSVKHQLFHLYLMKCCYAEKCIQRKGRHACCVVRSYVVSCCFLGGCFVPDFCSQFSLSLSCCQRGDRLL